MKTMLPMAVRGPALVGNSDGQPPGPSRHWPARRPRNIQQARHGASPSGSAPIALIFAIDFRLILTGLARPGGPSRCAGQGGGAMLSRRKRWGGGGSMRVTLSLVFVLLLAACTSAPPERLVFG